MSNAPLAALSPLDEERFGVRTAKAFAVTAARLPAVLEFCRARAVRLLIARCRADDLEAAQAMERAGFLLMDTLVYYVLDLGVAHPGRTGSDVLVRPLAAGEAAAVEAIAAAAFRGYAGHYHADPRLDRERCDAVYTSWARRSCEQREVADAVLVAERAGRLIGFATLKAADAEVGEGVLFGVAPAAQGTGVYGALTDASIAWWRTRGARRMRVSTQLGNVAVQRAWVHRGFVLERAVYTFHRWFDP